MISPSWTKAIGPPRAASGETWPIEAPLVAPLKRPSVISATVEPSPIPEIADVGLSISLIPGPPFGPSYRITTTSPGFIFPPLIASIASSSLSNTLAGPSCLSISGATALLFTTHVSGARFPLSTAIPPFGIYGSSISLIISWFLFIHPLMFSPTVFPVQVIQSVLIRFFFASSPSTA